MSTRNAFRLLLAVAAVSNGALAQFSSLSAPVDGSAVYFATPLHEKNTAEPAYGKIFRVDASGLHLLFSREIANRNQACSNAYDLTGIATSSDGAVLAVSGQCSCLDGNPVDEYNCVKIDRYTATVVSGGQSKDYPGEFWLSRNGKLALNRQGTNISFNPYAYHVIDLTTGKTLAAYGNGTGSANQFLLLDTTVTAAGRAVADDGTAVVTAGNLFILAGGAIQRVAPPSSQIALADATIDAAGQTIVLTAHNSVTSGNSLRITAPGVPTTDLFVSDGYLPSMTDDGREVLYLSARSGTPQAYLIGIDGNGDHLLTNEGDGLAEAILSGDGAVAYALTPGGRLLRISVASDTVEELIPRTPFLTAPEPLLAPGKRVVLHGGGLTDGSFSAVPPLPVSLGGVSIAIQGSPASILNVDPASIDLLVPEGVTPNDSTAPLHLEADSPSPFAGEFDTTAGVLPAAPEPVKTVHEDWSALVSADRPAHPGEILHTYAFGLGLTVPAVPLGEAAPAVEPLARVSPPLACMDSAGTALDVLYAGLAPGMVAVYQVDWRVPATAESGFRTSCAIGSGSTFALAVPVAPAP
jgi:uncharacterized protein (TIGR03437 family)